MIILINFKRHTYAQLAYYSIKQILSTEALKPVDQKCFEKQMKFSVSKCLASSNYVAK